MCSVDNCHNKSSTCGYCHKHYKRIQIYGYENFTKQCDLKGLLCKIENCKKPARKKYLCNSHYTKQWRIDNPEKAKTNIRHSWYRRGLRRRNANGKHTMAEWQELLSKHNNKCFYCGKTADTKDHIIPLAKGGSDEIANIVPACRSCNCKKHLTSFDDFLLVLHNSRNHDVQPLRMSEQGINIGGNYYA